MNEETFSRKILAICYQLEFISMNLNARKKLEDELLYLVEGRKKYRIILGKEEKINGS